MKTLTLKEARALLKKAVAKKGEDYVYPKGRFGNFGPSCVYAYWTEENEVAPSCLVGHALIDFMPELTYDIVFSENKATEGLYAQGSIRGIASQMQADGVLKITPEALAYLARAQHRQDESYTWGASLEAAERMLTEDDNDSE